MKRKLVKHGDATMMISLPAKWLRENKHGKGDELEVTERGRELIVGGSLEKGKQSTEISLGSLTESSIRTILTNAYRVGYDKIKVYFKDKKAVEIIESTLHTDLLGFELIKKEKDYVIIENITEPSKDQFDNIFSKIFLNIDDLFEILEDNFRGEKKEFSQTEQKIKQFDNFCRRIISKKGLDDDLRLKWVFHSDLIHAQREIYHVLRYLEKNKIKISKEILDLLENSKKIFELLKQSYNEKNILKLEQIHDLEKEIYYKKGYNLLRKVKDNESIIVHHLLNTIRGFYLASSPLIGLFIK
jgi:phosphate uptake regulator